MSINPINNGAGTDLKKLIFILNLFRAGSSTSIQVNSTETERCQLGNCFYFTCSKVALSQQVVSARVLSQRVSALDLSQEVLSAWVDLLLHPPGVGLSPTRLRQHLITFPSTKIFGNQ